jgi:hypothetical protein
MTFQFDVNFETEAYSCNSSACVCVYMNFGVQQRTITYDLTRSSGRFCAFCFASARLDDNLQHPRSAPDKKNTRSLRIRTHANTHIRYVALLQQSEALRDCMLLFPARIVE